MGFLKPDKTITIPSGLTIKQYFLTEHNPNSIAIPTKRNLNVPLIGVTLHNTEDIDEASGTTDAEQYVRATLNGAMGSVRVHYYVDDIEAWQCLPDTHTSWHAATGARGPGNLNTISIECIMDSMTSAQSIKARQNAVKLIAYLFEKYSWTAEKNLYAHNYWTNWLATNKMGDPVVQSIIKVSNMQKQKSNPSALANKEGKYCPVHILPHWLDFVKEVDSAMTKGAPVPKQSIHDVAMDVISGKYGNGDDRKQNVEHAGYSYSAVQTEVTKILSTISTTVNYVVTVTTLLNYRKGPSINAPICGQVNTGEKYTIVSEQTASDGSVWGQLKSGAGWINLAYTTK